LSTEALRAKERWAVQAWGQKSLRAIKLKDKLRVNMGQCEPKERDFKQGFKELQEARPETIKIKKKKQ
jgi:hypothetical protein